MFTDEIMETMDVATDVAEDTTTDVITDVITDPVKWSPDFKSMVLGGLIVIGVKAAYKYVPKGVRMLKAFFDKNKAKNHLGEDDDDDMALFHDNDDNVDNDSAPTKDDTTNNDSNNNKQT